MPEPPALRNLILDLEQVDPDQAYASWAAHIEGCLSCAGAGELDLEHVCARGRFLVERWLASERTAAAAANW